MTITASSAWAALGAHRDACATVHLRDLFDRDPQRAESFSLSFDSILFDYSKQRVSSQTLGLLVDLARQAQLPALLEWEGVLRHLRWQSRIRSLVPCVSCLSSASAAFWL